MSALDFFFPGYAKTQNQKQLLLQTGRGYAAQTKDPRIKGLLESDNPGDVQAGMGLLSEQRLADLVGQKAQQPYQPGQGMAPLRDTTGKGLLGGEFSMPEFYAKLAGLGGDYTKQGIAGLTALQPNAANSPAAVREFEFFEKLGREKGPEAQRQFLEIKRAFQPYTAIDYQGGKAAFDKRVGAVNPLSTAAQEGAGQATVDAAKKAAVVTAEGRAGAALDLPRVESFANQTLEQINEMRKHPGRQLATGTSAVLPKLPGTSQADFIARLDQMKGGQFLQAYQLLKGAGQISEIEGTKAENAIARMDRAQTEKEFVKALDDYEEVIKTGRDNMRRKAGTVSSQQQSNVQGNPQIRKTIGGKTYVKRGSEWFQE